MSIFENVKKTSHPIAHGEVRFFKIESGFVDEQTLSDFEECDKDGNYIVGHSESGHCHVLERDSVTIKRGQHEGMDMLYAIVDAPTKIKQNAANPHGSDVIQPGKYIIPNDREYNPFTQQARRVAD